MPLERNREVEDVMLTALVNSSSKAVGEYNKANPKKDGTVPLTTDPQQVLLLSLIGIRLGAIEELLTELSKQGVFDPSKPGFKM